MHIKVGYDPGTNMMGLPPVLLVDIITLAKRGCDLTIASYNNDPEIHIDKVVLILNVMKGLYTEMCQRKILPKHYRIEWDVLGEVNAGPKDEN